MIWWLARLLIRSHGSGDHWGSWHCDELRNGFVSKSERPNAGPQMMFYWSLLVGAVNDFGVFGWMKLLLCAVVGFDHVYGWCCSSGLTSFSGPACERCSVSTVSGTHLLPPTSHPPTFYIFLYFTLYFNSVWLPDSGTHLLPSHLLVHSLIFQLIYPFAFHILHFIFHIL